MLLVSINGQKHSVGPGQTILCALSSTGVSVPALCNDPRLAPIGACRLCLVEIRGQNRPVPACTTMLADGMEISTHTNQLEQLRRTQLRLLARRYPAPTSDQAPSNRFLELIAAYGLEHELGTAICSDPNVDSHPCIQVDMSRCIQCFRCVRICDEVAGRSVWRAWNRGDRTEIRPVQGADLRLSGCVSCGACVDTCPSGALGDKPLTPVAAPTREVRTICPYCGAGCEMWVGTNKEHITGVRPVMDARVNRGHLCVKGRYGWDFVHAPDRITRPMIREDDAWRPVSWGRALDFVSHQFAKTIATHGPDAVGVLGSARATNEENYLIQKFARVVIGTNNVDCCARVCHAPTAAGMKLMLGTGAATNSFDDIELAKTIVVCGANPTENHPIVGDRIRQAVRHGATLIVIDPRRTELTDCAAIHLRVRPGANVLLLNALANAVVSENLQDASFIRDRVDDWEEFKSFIAAYWADSVANDCGVDAEQIRQAARALAIQRPTMFIHGLGLTEHSQGTEGVMCLVNLALLTGNVGRIGGGINPLRGQNNVQGAAHMGCDPGVLTGGVPLDEHRTRFEALWKAPLPVHRGLNAMEMIDAAAAGRVKVMYVVGYDVALTNPHAMSTLAALRALDLLVVQDLFLNETARLAANVFLPACSSFEKDGTFMNSERRVQRVRKAINTVEESLPDWAILCRLAHCLGHGDKFRYLDAKDVWDEVRQAWPAGAGITYERLESGGLQWPCPSEDHPGTRILHTGQFAHGAPAKLRRVPFSPTTERTSDEFPFLLNTGRTLYQFNAGTMTGRSRPAIFCPTDVLQMSTTDANRLDVCPADEVQVTSRYGETVMRAHVTDAVAPGQLFATFHSRAAFVNRLTSRHCDSYVQTPEYKVTAVQVKRIPGINPAS
jgi:formate dehydrogenase major subunit